MAGGDQGGSPTTATIRVNEALSALGVAGATSPKILACLSGGADSTFLTYALNSIGCEVTAFHLDHMLRPDSDSDSARATAIADSLGIEIVIRRQKPEVRAGSSPETAARHLRYVVAEAVADEVGADWIATGHTADDQIETFFINLARGAGLDGLAGIPPTRGKVVRPLLGVFRSETRDACRTLGLDYIDDPTNLERTILRNRIRLDLMPKLADVLGANFRDSMLRQFGYLRGDAELLNALADAKLRDAHLIAGGAAIAVDIETITETPGALARRVVRRALALIGVETPPAGGFVDDAVAIASGGGACDLGGGYMARREGESLVIRPRVIEAPESALGELPGQIVCPGFGLVVTGESANAPDRWEEARDSAWISESSAGSYVIRVPRAGDRCSPVGLHGSKSVSDVLAEIGMGRTERETAPVLARGDSDEAQVVWPIGHRVDVSVAVPLGAPRAIAVRVEPLA